LVEVVENLSLYSKE